MSSKAPAVGHHTLGAWLLKASPAASPVGHLVRTRFAAVTSWCIRRTYRAELVEPGQRVLLWVSGQDEEHPAGIYAQGRTAGRAVHDFSDGSAVDSDRAELVMPVGLEPLEPVIRRTEILAHPVLSQIEVVRMPAGSNPSFLSRAHLEELRRTWPQVR